MAKKKGELTKEMRNLVKKRKSLARKRYSNVKHLPDKHAREAENLLKKLLSSIEKEEKYTMALVQYIDKQDVKIQKQRKETVKLQKKLDGIIWKSATGKTK